ncbi:MULTISPECIES: hypothetical protein [unclassified Bradyrhizobium]|nr:MULTISPECIES: hypothetical protein [unclassified Bradyrhizobium]
MTASGVRLAEQVSIPATISLSQLANRRMEEFSEPAIVAHEMAV